MHIPDGFVSAPINAAAFAVSVAVCGAAVVRANHTLGERQVPLLGMTAAFIFAAQMLNFPVLTGTSGHFLGAVLAAVLLGPLNACLILALVLLVQCLLFSDGGLTALGSNVFNMGVVGGIGGYAVFRLLLSLLPKTRAGFMAAAAAASWTSIVAAAISCAVELAISGTSPLALALPAMAGVHALIGIGEAFITCATLSVILASRPDLVGAWTKSAVSPQLEGER
ncbi:MAG: energy-coupling factor ABC transporter permease [Candidatus Hydrogenedentes bacterium]|nr:energy-coupling factor ABC transporter permease [Candidatus Hydrogenedentota bacterium]